MKRVIKELGILKEEGEDLTKVIEKLRAVCYKNMRKKGDFSYINKAKEKRA